MASRRTLQETERWVAWVRLGAVVFVLSQLLLLNVDYPNRRYEVCAWVTTGLLTFGALLFLWLSRLPLSRRALARLGFAALVFDAAIVSAYVLVYSFEAGTPVRQALVIPIVEAALRYGLLGGVLMPLAFAAVHAGFEYLRSERFDHPYDIDNVTFPVGVGVISGLIVGWLVEQLRGQTILSRRRAHEAEALRDELGRRADLLDAANSCARALSSSLDLEQAFSAFIRELRGLVPFDRTAIVLADDATAQVIATAGLGADEVFPPGFRGAVPGSVLEEVLRTGQPVYRRDMAEAVHPEEKTFIELGLRCRLAAPLLSGAQAIGMLSLVRRDPDAFEEQEIELVTLLGRFLGATVQNIRAYEAERETVEELRRLSALRADFVSLVSHELRSPMASLIGSAQTLRERWRELSAEQRESFLGLIAHETSRLSALVEDVLDTSRIEAGTFSYSFADVDLGRLVRAASAAAESGQDEVAVRAEVSAGLPSVRGDAERLRQVLSNLIDNAVKYSTSGGEVRVRTFAENGRVQVAVSDRGPGIPSEQQRLIFEKFGRAKLGDKTKPGTGLGLYIARSIAEAHGGGIGVDSVPDRGTTFTLTLPLDPPPA
jgi:two-component system, OmpR family, phosphate regulon sensor histidine kinase PhoR